MSPADLTKPFAESCCDGGAMVNDNSCQPCGCDKGANHMCQRHVNEGVERAKAEGMKFIEAANTLQDYGKFVVERAKQPLGEKGDPYSFIGLAGETGEVMEWLKKSVYRKDPAYHELDLLWELGDVIHYVVRIGHVYGWTLKDIMQANMDKLEARK